MLYVVGRRKALQQQSDTWPYGHDQRIREHACRALKRREVPTPRQHRGSETDTLTGEALSVRSGPQKRTHRVVQRIDRILERVDRILQGSLGRARVSLV